MVEWYIEKRRKFSLFADRLLPQQWAVDTATLMVADESGWLIMGVIVLTSS
jgi:hypothetical protein